MLSHIYHEPNERGVDYFVGDIHGEYQVLIDKLREVEFDRENDRLFCTGDMIDRGPDSYSCAKLIDQPYVFSVLGNHEDMMIDVLTGEGDFQEYAKALSFQNGGSWVELLNSYEERELLRLLKLLPISRTVASSIADKPLGVIHAGWRKQWKSLQADTALRVRDLEIALWERRESLGNLQDEVAEFVVCGHQHLAAIDIFGDHCCIDVSKSPGKLVVISERELREMKYARSSQS